MKKFAITLTHGNDKTILALLDTKEEAMAAGEQYRKQYSRKQGLLTIYMAHSYDFLKDMQGDFS